MKPFQFDWSRISTHQWCPCKGDFQYERHLRPLLKPKPLSFGAALHEGLYELYKEWNIAEALKTFSGVYEELPEDWRTEELGGDVLTRYAQQYEGDGIKTLQNETGFALPLEGDIIYCGRMDKIIEDELGVWVMEHKSASRMGTTYFQKFRPDGQTTGYTGGAKLLSGLEIQGVLLDILYFTKDGKKGPGARAFERHHLRLQQWEIDDYFKEVVVEAQHIQMCRERNFFPRHTGMCDIYGTCPYRLICNTRGDEGMIENNYVVDEWDPFPLTEPIETAQAIEMKEVIDGSESSEG